MKITADTNVLVSATFWYGDSNRIIEKVERKEIELVLSKEILEEFSAVLDYKEIKDKIKGKGLEMKRTVEKIASISTIVKPKERVELIERIPTIIRY
ncbi:MAG: putative toxin-antitoxin system toxin component, PIN family [archaeon]